MEGTKEIWCGTNSIIKNEDYIRKLLKRFKINKYQFINNGYGENDLLLNYNLNDWKITINEDKLSLILFKKLVYRKNQKHCKEYFEEHKSFNERVDNIYICLKYIISYKI